MTGIVTARRQTTLGLLAAAGVAVTKSVSAAPELAPIILPAPRSDFGRSLGQALNMRRSQRDFASRPLPIQVLSELLWSAYGVNRPGTEDRTAPSWRHARETEIYAAMESGTWRYDPVAHRLQPHLAGDIRAQTGAQDFVAVAPLTLVYVSDATHMSGVSAQEQRRFAAADTGFIGQNVYLYCASELLACVFRGSLDAERLGRTLNLAETQFIEFAQTVGYPKG
jgi:nitroreductase